ncbi:MAG: trigger factor [Candidatus Aminicenantes bacterium]|nr:trigger factor [Candidatus Aminicenantes bacterium]
MKEEELWFKDKVNEIGPNSKEISFEIPVAVVQAEYEKILDFYMKRAKIPGFRIGKAPRDIIRRTFALEIKERLIENLVPRAVEESLKNHSFNPAAEPIIRDINWEEGHPLTFKAQIDLWPDFRLPDYRAIKITPPKNEINEEEIERVLKELQQRSTEYIPVIDRGLAPGDLALLEIKAKDLKTKKYWPTKKIQIEAGQKESDPLLEENIFGLIPGETRTFVVHYPLDYSDSALAGKHIEYTVRMIALREKKVPEINDDFARSLGNFDNLEQLKTKIKEDLEEKKKEESRKEVLENILDKLAAEASILLPEAAIQAESRSLLNRWLAHQKDYKWTEAEIVALEQEARRQAEKKLRDRLILEKIAQKEGFTVEAEEVEEEIKSLAKANRLSFFELKERLEREGRLEILRHNLLLRKVVDFLIKLAL